EIGNSTDDSLLQKVILSALPSEPNETNAIIPNWYTYDYNSFRDPYLLYELRNKGYISQRDFDGFTRISNEAKDIILPNMNAKGGNNIFTNESQTPTSNSDENVVAKESFIFLLPLHSKF